MLWHLFTNLDSNNHYFITGKFGGLDERAEVLVVMGMNPKNLKQAMEKISRNDDHFKKMSLEAGRDLRFPTRRKEGKKLLVTFESEIGKEIMANKELLKTPLGKKLVEQMKKNAANAPK